MLSPDGRRLAMVAADATGNTRLWTRDLRDASPHALDGTDGARWALWSPDSTELAFVTPGQIQRTAATGGPASLIATVNPRSVVWLPGGDILAAVDGQGLLRVSSAGGSLRPAGGFSSDALRNLQIDGLDVSSDGRSLLFTQFGGDTGIYVARLDGSGRRALYPGKQSLAVFVGSDLIVRQDANVLVAQRFNSSDMTLVGEAFPVAQNVGAFDFAAGASGALSFKSGARDLSRLTWFTREGKPDGVIGSVGTYDEVAISRGGRWLGFSRADAVDGNVDVWLQALPGGAPSRLTSDPDVDHLLAISQDERYVAWEAHAKGALNLMRRPVDGSSAAQLIRPWGRAGGPCDWSPDGRVVLYESDDGVDGLNLWAVPTDGSGSPARVTPPGSGASDGQFSPDGRWLAFVGRATGENDVYVQRVEGLKLLGGPVRVSESGGQRPLWRRDGAELFYIDRGTLMVADFREASDRPAGTPRSLFKIAGLADSVRFNLGRAFAVTPDGQRFVAIVSTIDATPHPATVILNWRASIVDRSGK